MASATQCLESGIFWGEAGTRAEMSSHAVIWLGCTPTPHSKASAGVATDSESSAWTHHGVGLGFGNCARITMPLAPTLGVIIARNERESRSISAADFNRATVFNSREFVAHHPDGLTDPKLRYALHDDMRTQRWILPIIWEATLNAADQEARKYAEQPTQPF